MKKKIATLSLLIALFAAPLAANASYSLTASRYKGYAYIDKSSSSPGYVYTYISFTTANGYKDIYRDTGKGWAKSTATGTFNSVYSAVGNTYTNFYKDKSYYH